MTVASFIGSECGCVFGECLTLILFTYLIVLSLTRTIAEHYSGKSRLYLVQPHRVQGSWNCCKKVRFFTAKKNCDSNLNQFLVLYVMLLNFFFFRLREHVHGDDNNPLLIFPEGTCVNNHYTVMFKKVFLTCMPTSVHKLS